MNYTENDILDIIKSLTNKNAEEILLNWNLNKSNTFLDLKEENKYDNFIFSFPLLINSEEVATITVVDLYHCNGVRDYLMQKYFGHEKYERSYCVFSHDTFLTCYITIHKEFELPKIVESFYGKNDKYFDAKGVEFEYRISYGYPLNENESYVYHHYTNKSYRFDNDINIIVDIENGYSLGKKINENIRKRKRDILINKLL